MTIGLRSWVLSLAGRLLGPVVPELPPPAELVLVRPPPVPPPRAPAGLPALRRGALGALRCRGLPDEEAEEIVQEVCLRTIERGYPWTGAVGWTIARSVVLDRQQYALRALRCADRARESLHHASADRADLGDLDRLLRRAEPADRQLLVSLFDVEARVDLELQELGRDPRDELARLRARDVLYKRRARAIGRIRSQLGQLGEEA